METRQNVEKALTKCAVGLSASEVVEEFVVEDGEERLVKRKVTRREIPPDLKAVKMLLDQGFSAATDEELIKEREELIKRLKEEEGD